MLDKIKDQQLSSLNTYIEEKSWNSAKDLIKSLNLPPPLEKYNLAYLAHLQGDDVYAIKTLENIKYRGMFSKDVDLAIKEVQKSLDIYYIEERMNAFDKTIISLKLVPQDFFIATSLSFLVIGLSILLVKKRMIASIFIALGLSMAAIIYPLSLYEVSYNLEEKIVYSGPSTIFEQTQIVPKGLKVVFTKIDSDWKYIQFPESFRGWIYQPKVLK